MPKVTGEQFAAKAAELLSRNEIPYVKGGETLKGMDCQGLVRWVMRELGMVLPAQKGTNYLWRNGLSEKGSIADCTIRWGKVPLGALVFIRDYDGGEPDTYQDHEGNIWHVYVKLREGLLIHASAGNGFVLTRAFADKEIVNGGPNAYGLLEGVAYTGSRVPSDMRPWDGTDEAWDEDEGEAGDASGGAVEGVEAAPAATPEGLFNSTVTPPSSRYFAVVSTPNGGPVNMRAEPSKACKLSKEVPNGETVLVIGSVVKAGATWCRVERNSRKWYIMADYLKRGAG